MPRGAVDAAVVKNSAAKNPTRSSFAVTSSCTTSEARIRVEYVNPFIESVSNMFKTMLNTQVNREDPGVVKHLAPSLDIVALIGLSGGIRGLVALAFPVRTVLAMVSKAYGTEIVVVDDRVLDAVAEFVNVVAGGAQARFSDGADTPIDLSLPAVIRGREFGIVYPSLGTWIEVPFESELGRFVFRVTMKENNGNKTGR